MKPKPEGLPTPHDNTLGVEPPPLPPEAVVEAELEGFESLDDQKTHIPAEQAIKEMDKAEEIDKVNAELDSESKIDPNVTHFAA
ncbi:hypothetical protein C0581_04675 [Candidatus Parcubacteria bacterium]|nr:MAG: hypothetical protein C0581_04675 [Candidatus Parcubacteria bacterium]